MRWLPVMLLTTATSLTAQTNENAEHRADRLRTEELNRSAAAAVSRRDRAGQPDFDKYQKARERYARQLAEWRRRVADCERGYYEACDKR